MDGVLGGSWGHGVGATIVQGTPTRRPVACQLLADPHMHGRIPPRGPLRKPAGRPSPVRHGETSARGRPRCSASHRDDVSQTSTGRARSRAVRWAHQVSWTCMRPTWHTGHPAERDGRGGPGWARSPAARTSVEGRAACPRIRRQSGSVTFRTP